MFDVLWEAAGGPMLATLMVGIVLFLFSARRITAIAHLVARGTAGKVAREKADPLANLSFDERVAARLKELQGEKRSGAFDDQAGTDAWPSSQTRRGFGRRGADPS